MEYVRLASEGKRLHVSLIHGRSQARAMPEKIFSRKRIFF